MKFATAVACGVIVSFAAAIAGAQTARPIVNEESIKADMQLNVCKNAHRLEAVKGLFKKKGATEDEIRIEKLDGVENLVVEKIGKSEESIIVGAHYDKVSDGWGALDNWSGIVVLANLFAIFRHIPTNKTIIFAAFGKEEVGLVGSRAMAKSIPKEKRELFCSMINFDSFGFSYPQVLSNASDPKMTKAAEELAKEEKMPFTQVLLNGVADADSTSFRDKEIPAITFSGLTSKWPEYLHTSKDILDNVNYQSVLVGYNFAGLFLTRIEAKPCNTFR